MIESIKKVLKESGCSAELAHAIANQIAAEVGRLTVPKKEFNAKAALAKRLQQQLQEQQLEAARLQKEMDTVHTLQEQLLSMRDKHAIEDGEIKAHLETLVFNHTLILNFLEANVKHAEAAQHLLESKSDRSRAPQYNA